MEKPNTNRIYPSAPLEAPMHEQQQNLLPPAPPSYDQATGTAPPGTGASATALPDSHVIVITSPAAGPYGPHPVDVLCPFCHNYTRTRVRHTPTSRTHIIALILCLLQLYCCVCIPYCIPSCMNTNHYCGMCDHYLGTFQRV